MNSKTPTEEKILELEEKVKTLEDTVKSLQGIIDDHAHWYDDLKERFNEVIDYVLNGDKR